MIAKLEEIPGVKRFVSSVANMKGVTHNFCCVLFRTFPVISHSRCSSSTLEEEKWSFHCLHPALLVRTVSSGSMQENLFDVRMLASCSVEVSCFRVRETIKP